jgi:citrate lyase subunit beta/citryl-CoA lyase
VIDPPNYRPRRSVLYVPAINERAMAKARTLPVDGLIIDLEDSVAPAQKAAARANLFRSLHGGDFTSAEVVVRINGLDSPWGKDDLAAVIDLPLQGVLLPKIQSRRQVLTTIDVLGLLGANPDLPLWLMAETPRGILELADIASASHHVKVIVMGTADLGKAARIPESDDRMGMLYALSHCVMVARGLGLDVLDGVFGNLEDDAGFRAACEHGRALGFDGKTLIHPRQIDYANEAFGVTAGQLTHARRVLAAWEDASSQGLGVAVLDGQLVEHLHVDEAERTVAMAAAIQRRNGR